MEHVTEISNTVRSTSIFSPVKKIERDACYLYSLLLFLRSDTDEVATTLPIVLPFYSFVSLVENKREGKEQMSSLILF